jgi:hypothetical protein
LIRRDNRSAKLFSRANRRSPERLALHGATAARLKGSRYADAFALRT